MADFSGRKISVGIGKETTRGTAVAPAYWPYHLELDFLNKVEKIYNESAFGVLDKYTTSEVVKQWAEGSLSGKVTDKTFGLILAAAFGAAPSNAANADVSGLVFDHTYATTNSNTGLTLTVARKDPNSDRRHALAVVKSLEIEVVVGEFVKFKAELMSKLGVTASDTVAYTIENEFKAKYATVKMASAIAGLGAATAIPLKSLKITLTRKVEDYFVFGSNDVAEMFNGDFEVKGDMVLRYTDGTYESLWSANTLQATQLVLTNTDVVIGTAANPSMTLTLPKASLSEWSIDQGIDKMVEQTVGFTGLYDTATAATITAVLTNLVASY